MECDEKTQRLKKKMMMIKEESLVFSLRGVAMNAVCLSNFLQSGRSFREEEEEAGRNLDVVILIFSLVFFRQ